ncbi:MAG: HD domain-containing protein [Candidatus Thermoplasmatota archaeon]|nr:HD domain-containing protein [Candidatus Thermoplasmatota archaeon]
MSEHKIINDPVHGTIKISGPLLELAATPEINRLNQIRQLGLAYLVFPGAHHTRYEHSFGVAHVAGLLADSIGLEEHESDLVRTAGLLHDIGHGPFSHTMEKIFFDRIGMDHMALTRDIIIGVADQWDEEWWRSRGVERGPTVPQLLERHDLEPKKVAALICQEHPGAPPGQQTLDLQEKQSYFSSRRYLYQIIHSALDADQLDFLLRDSHYTGVAYGIIDLDRIIATTTLFHGELMVERRGISSLEGMLVARSLMYSSVYFHKTARIAESMLCRAGETLTDEELEDLWKMPDGEALRFMRERPGPCGELSTRLTYRKLYKSAFRTDSEMIVGESEAAITMRERIKELSDKNASARLEREIERKVSMPEGSVILDIPDPSLTLFEPRLRRTDIKVLGDRPEILSRISSLARALQRRPPIPWCLMISCPEEYVPDVKRVAGTLLQ